MSTAPKEVLELVQKFERNIESYQSSAYNEAQVRQEFINPLFELLGWDIPNKQGFAEAYKEVIHEAAVKIGPATKAPDYAFRIGGTKKFFLEAKKPGIDIKNNPEPGYQLRRYAWSAGLPLSILTDFEEFAVYDCRIRPQKNDKAHVGRIKYFTYQEYETRWAEIAEVFSKQAIQQGSFDRFVVSAKGKRGTSPVDDAILEEIEEWRSELARNLARKNRRLKVRDLNFAVQRIIDRIIFLRMCEDRGIELYGQLQALLNGENVYARLKQLFYAADDKYNSGLFHFKREPGRAEKPDELTDTLKIDNEVLKQIIGRLYYPESPYEFSVLSSDILGNVYEQFLGKVIHLTQTHQARIEEKPEVKKAGGVYYTPKYIVDYIVKNTVGKLCEGKTPKQIEKLKILDPACGSGSFLIGAYSFLLDYHRDWYVKNTPSDPSGLVPLGKGDKKEIFQGSGGQWYLTTQKKKEILLNNIYGVDIDNQAVEVTKLNLLLKVLEGETKDTLESQMKLFHRRALPDLGNNIKCGNSLIGSDYYYGKQQTLFDEEVQTKVNAFDWKSEFPEIMKQGGFDTVLGNPPYLYSAGQDDIEYFKGKFKLSQYQTDFYVYFIEAGYNLLRKGGTLSFIVSNSWLKGKYFSNLRTFLLAKPRLERIAIFDYPVFKKAALENSILIVSASSPEPTIPLFKFTTPANSQQIKTLDRKVCLTKDIIDVFGSESTDKLILKIEKDAQPLDSTLEVNRGVHAYRTDGYGRSKFSSGYQTKKDKDVKSYHSAVKKNRTFFPELKGKDLFRFRWRNSGEYISYGDWLAEPRAPKFFFNSKLGIRKILGDKLFGTYIENDVILDQSIYVLIHPENSKTILKYCLGILLSRLGAWYLRTKHSIYDKLYPWYTKEQLASFPMKHPVNSKLVDLVEHMLELHKQSDKAKTPDDKTRVERQIEATDRQINQLVYELYGLTEEEIAVVEGRKQ